MTTQSEYFDTNYSIAKRLPAMESGFEIHTAYGDIVISTEEAAPIISATRRFLQRKLARLEKLKAKEDSRDAFGRCDTPVIGEHWHAKAKGRKED